MKICNFRENEKGISCLYIDDKPAFLEKYFPTLYLQDTKIVQHVLTTLIGVNSRGPQRLHNALIVTEGVIRYRIQNTELS